jgi:hypothetical protein
MSGHKKSKASKVKALKVDSIDLDSFDEYKSSVDLDNKGKLIKLLTQMFVAGDHDAFMELMELYIDHVGKRKISKKANIPEKTIYNFKDKKHKTSSENIFKMMKAISDKDAQAKAG